MAHDCSDSDRISWKFFQWKISMGSGGSVVKIQFRTSAKKHSHFHYRYVFWAVLAISLVSIVSYLSGRFSKPAVHHRHSARPFNAHLRPSAAHSPVHKVQSKPDAIRAWSNRPPLPAGQKLAFLTFDDGPGAYTPRLLTILKKSHVKATFFITFAGRDTPQKRTWVRMEQAAGQTIGVHSWTHNYRYIYSREQNFTEDFRKMKQILIQVTGEEPKLFRFPGGVSNTASLHYHYNKPIMPKLLADIAEEGMTPFDWTAGGEDAQTSRTIPSAYFAFDILRDVGRQPHPIILMHDTDRSSVDAVPMVIAHLRARGYRFAVLSPKMRPVIAKPAAAVHSHKKRK
jgi:peptidoglycan/xylan/chitin deacetylase (PgdA/CDA1 family)